MAFDSDFALFGTGLAPLIAANALISQGKSVLVLNPDWDFFLEDSELPLDPFLLAPPTPELLQLNGPEKAIEELRPSFPGAIEFWAPRSDSSKEDNRGFHDPDAPHLRQRSRLWISSPDKDRLWNWPQLEDLYVEAEDAGLNPQILDGLIAARRFPGFSEHSENLRGLFLPKFYDLDTVRYRCGVLEYIRERLSPEKRVLCATSELEWMPEGIRFRTAGESHTAKLSSGLLVFWTPRLTPWIVNYAKRMELKLKMPKGFRVWEQWLLNSRDPLDPSTVGLFSDVAVWADFEGAPPPKIHRLSVLRASPLMGLDPTYPLSALSDLDWASAKSLGALFSLCQDFLKWDRFSVRSLKTRTILEWDSLSPGHDSIVTPSAKVSANPTKPSVQFIPGCDGPILNIIRAVRSVCEEKPS